ncbi:MAG: MBL fold metallo-hydrolase [Candidatus Bathyarchaeota archaeon]
MKITFQGGIREIGGSCTVVKTENAQVALDYGINLDQGITDGLPKDLDAIIATHAHLDHSGNLLTMADKHTPIIGSKATRDVTSELLHDLIKVQRMNGKDIPYNSDDVNKIKELWLPRERVALTGMEISLQPAGHVLGANMACLKTEGKTIIYTGDFCLHNTDMLDGANLQGLPINPDILIMESTYGGVVRPNRVELINTMLSKISETLEKGGNVLIPSFAFHRTQEMALRIDAALKEGSIPRCKAYYISRLAHRITRHFDNYKNLLGKSVREEKMPFAYKRVKHLRKVQDIAEPAVVICTSGFGHAGASLHLLKEWAENEDNLVIISSGYLPPDSPLKIAQEKKIIENNGNSVPVKAKIEQIELSAHADQVELSEFVRTLKPKRTFLVHGELLQCQAIAGQITDYTDVSIPEAHETVCI